MNKQTPAMQQHDFDEFVISDDELLQAIQPYTVAYQESKNFNVISEDSWQFE